MKLEVNLKDVIVFALILAIIVIGGIKIVKLEAAMQTAALVKTVNDHDAVIRKIVEYLNGKAVGSNPATKQPAQGQPPPIK